MLITTEIIKSYDFTYFHNADQLPIFHLEQLITVIWPEAGAIWIQRGEVKCACRFVIFFFFFFLTKGVDVLFFRFPFLKQIKHKSWYKGE